MEKRDKDLADTYLFLCAAFCVLLALTGISALAIPIGYCFGLFAIYVEPFDITKL